MNHDAATQLAEPAPAARLTAGSTGAVPAASHSSAPAREVPAAGAPIARGRAFLRAVTSLAAWAAAGFTLLVLGHATLQLRMRAEDITPLQADAILGQSFAVVVIAAAVFWAIPSIPAPRWFR